jgi:hypothetical protein
MYGEDSGEQDDSKSWSPPCPKHYIPIRCSEVDLSKSDGSRFYPENGTCMAQKRGHVSGSAKVGLGSTVCHPRLLCQNDKYRFVSLISQMTTISLSYDDDDDDDIDECIDYKRTLVKITNL